MNADVCRVYELPGVQQVTGATIRPGGLALTERALALAELPGGARVLDVGCGAAATLQHLHTQNFRATGVDLSAKLLRQGQARVPDLDLSQSEGEQLPFAAAQFEAVLAECCLSLMKAPVAALREWGRVLRPRGTLILSDMLARNGQAVAAARQLPLSCCLSGAFSRAQIEAMLAETGFDLLFWEDQSEALKQLTVQIIWEYGSLANFWHCTTAEGEAVSTTMAALKPGYFLVLGRKRDTEGTEETRRFTEEKK